MTEQNQQGFLKGKFYLIKLLDFFEEMTSSINKEEPVLLEYLGKALKQEVCQLG